MTIYLGLGANAADDSQPAPPAGSSATPDTPPADPRTRNLERAIEALVAAGFALQKVSPLVESPALLPPHADPSWHKPYLNLAVAGDAPWQPEEGLAIVKRIERDLGRRPGQKWSPRTIDIDLLRWHDLRLNSAKLTLPHADESRRDFVLTPLMHLQPNLPLGAPGETAFARTQTIGPIPLWMAIINLTPDSFSDGNSWRNLDELDAYVGKLIARNVQIIDVGAESTRPGGETLSAADEWSRLQPALARIAAQLAGHHIKPWLSIDSRRAAIIDKALPYGLDIINDVSGLADPEMIAVARASGCQVVAMHSMSAPVNAALNLPAAVDDADATTQLRRWAEQKMEGWARAGLDLNRIILDPGIGFGKSATQALHLLAHCRDLRAVGLRLAVGHSRKSFMAAMSAARRPPQRDLETLGISLALCQQGVDIIRTHAPFMHQRAYLAWAHVGGAAGA